MKRFVLASVIVSWLVFTLDSDLTHGQGGGNPFIGHTDRGDIVHVLPAPASIRNPHDQEPVIAPPQGGLSIYKASYGSGNLVNHGGPQISGAGFFAVYWNSTVANAGGSGVTSLGYPNVQAQISAFTTAFSDGHNYSESDAGADYTVIQQYGRTNPISSAPLSPALTGVGYYIDPNNPTSGYPSAIADSDIQAYLSGLLASGAVPLSTEIVYGVYFPAGMTVTLNNSASCTNFCGYHGHFLVSGQDVKYAVFPFTNCLACSLSGLSVSDILTIVTGHEIRESVTDPDLNAWYDHSGNEADDKCAWHHLYQTANGGFWVQPEFSNGGTVTASGFTTTYPQGSRSSGGCVVAK